MRRNIHVLQEPSTTRRLWDRLKDVCAALQVFIVLLLAWDQLHQRSSAVEDIIVLEVQRHQHQLMGSLEIFVRSEHTVLQDLAITLFVQQEHSMRRMDQRMKMTVSHVPLEGIVMGEDCQHRQDYALKDIIVQQGKSFQVFYVPLGIIVLKEHRNHIYVHQECIKMREDNLNAKSVQLDTIVILMINVAPAITPCRELVRLGIIA